MADRFSWLMAEDRCCGVVDGLKEAYTTKLLPLERTTQFHTFHSPPLGTTEFDSLPQVLIIGKFTEHNTKNAIEQLMTGQYSTGKSSLIKYLLRSEFPGIRVGPEPTTDRFIVVAQVCSEL